MNRFIVSLLLFLFFIPAYSADKVSVTKFAEKPDIVNPVTITFDNKGRAFIGGTIRRRSGSLDIRGLRDWVKNDLSFESLEDKQNFYKEAMKAGSNSKAVKNDFNKDGAKDWKDLMFPEDPLICAIDTDKDGKADKFVKINNKTETFGAGILAGSLWHDGHLYTSHEPDIWKYSDTDSDGIPDKRVKISTGYSIHIGQGGHNTSGLAIGMDGRLYWSVADKGINATSPDGKNRVILPHRGAVMRCELDGSNLEVFAYGVRNAQELAFDKYNNLFSVDNDGDYPGEKERFLYLIEGGMTGWRLHWQWFKLQEFATISGERPYNVWMEEKMSVPYNPDQPAWIVPPVKNYQNGPCGMNYNPGTALSKEFQDCLFHANGGSIMAFRVKENGASFEMTDERTVAKGKVLTGLAFSPDGALYAGSCLGYPNYPAKNGFILKIDVENSDLASLRKETAVILAKGFKNLNEQTLDKYLSHADLRVRKNSQFELVKRGSAGQKILLNAALKGNSQLKRLHGIWGTGQISRKKSAAAAPLVSLLQDKDEQIRSQAAVVLGDARYKDAAESLIKLLKDPNLRVRSLAAIALGKLQDHRAIDSLLALAEENNSKDPWLRHAVVMGLAGSATGKANLLTEVAQHHSPAARMTALLALRRQHDPGIKVFLKDKDLKIVTEAARAIHDDFSIPGALPDLANALNKKDAAGEPFLRRAINANLRVGKEENAANLLKFIVSSKASEKMKTTAIAALAFWEKPPHLDPVEGRVRKYEKRDKTPGVKALTQLGSTYIPTAPKRLVQIYIRAVKKINSPEITAKLASIYDKSSDDVKLEILFAMKEMKSPAFKSYAQKAYGSSNKKLKEAAAILLGKNSFSDIEEKLKSKNLKDRKSAVAQLGRFPGAKADKTLTALVKSIVSFKKNRDLAYEIIESAKARASQSSSVKSALEGFNKKNKKGLGPYKVLMYGGDPVKGKEVAMGHPAAQCIRCHKIKNAGGILGPDLTLAAKNLKADKLLESLIFPNAEFSKGFGILTLKLKGGKIATGTFKDKSKTEYSLLTADGKIIKIPVADVESESKISPMPPMASILKPEEIRNLMAYLSTLK